MKRSTMVVALLGIASAALVLAEPAVSSRESSSALQAFDLCPDYTCQNDAETGNTSHSFSGGGPGNYACDGGGCHPFGVPGSCIAYHSICIVTDAFRRDGAFKMVEQTVAASNVADVSSLALQYENVRINRMRNVVQVLDCQGRVVAQYRIPSGPREAQRRG